MRWAFWIRGALIGCTLAQKFRVATAAVVALTF